ncbi:hypothetical protein [Spongorhabdus nitratireducens]
MFYCNKKHSKNKKEIKIFQKINFSLLFLSLFSFNCYSSPPPPLSPLKPLNLIHSSWLYAVILLPETVLRPRPHESESLDIEELTQLYKAFVFITQHLSNSNDSVIASMCSYNFLRKIHSHMEPDDIPAMQAEDPEHACLVEATFPYDCLSLTVVDALSEFRQGVKFSPEATELVFSLVAKESLEFGRNTCKIATLKSAQLIQLLKSIQQQAHALYQEKEAEFSARIVSLDRWGIEPPSEWEIACQCHTAVNLWTCSITSDLGISNYKTHEHEGFDFPTIYYTGIKQKNAQQAVDVCFQEFQENLQRAASIREKVARVAQCVRTIMLLHPFTDANARTLRVWYQGMLMALGSSPVIMNTCELMFTTEKVIEEHFYTGQGIYQRFLERLETGTFDNLGYRALNQQTRDELDQHFLPVILQAGAP